MSLRTIISRAFGRQWVPPLGDGRAADDWRVGDLAVCIVPSYVWTNFRTGHRCGGPDAGVVLRVAAVEIREGWHVLGFPGNLEWWTAECFRRVDPRQREACKPAFADQMKRLRPVVDA